ncbi:hypothetical protein PQR53_13150 [Paraburkholderia fungorum]|uniref:hypothetical protein n=1 Tax=Paraburkholderia fungorum TaxID=134537 RepID=UPI0038B9F9EF
MEGAAIDLLYLIDIIVFSGLVAAFVIGVRHASPRASRPSIKELGPVVEHLIVVAEH